MAAATRSLACAPGVLNLCRSALEHSARPQRMVRSSPLGRRSIELSAVRSFRSGILMPSRVSSSQSKSRRGFSLSTTVKSTIQVGEKLPEAELSYLDKEDNVQTVKVSELTKGKKVVLFAVPGAFTPTCSQKHVPGFVEKADELKSKGIDTIACVSVNDVFVLRAWGEDLGVGDKVLLLSDGNVNFTKALGVELDLSDKPVGLGVRSRRYALLADDGVVKQLNLEEGGAFSISGPDEILKALSNGQEGIEKEILRPGKGPKPVPGQSVTVHCTGYGKNGDLSKKFWSTKDSGQQPFTFVIGTQQVIAGWDEGVLGMGLGEVARLKCPPSYAYGSSGFSAWGIKPNSTLIFEIEVLKIA